MAISKSGEILWAFCVYSFLEKIDMTLRAGFTNTGQIAGLLNSSYF